MDLNIFLSDKKPEGKAPDKAPGQPLVSPPAPYAETSLPAIRETSPTDRGVLPAEQEAALAAPAAPVAPVAPAAPAAPVAPATPATQMVTPVIPAAQVVTPVVPIVPAVLRAQGAAPATSVSQEKQPRSPVRATRDETPQAPRVITLPADGRETHTTPKNPPVETSSASPIGLDATRSSEAVSATPTTPTASATSAIPAASATSARRRKKKRRTKLSTKQLFLIALRDALIPFALVIVLLQFFSPTIVREHSMENTLKNDDVLYIATKAYWFGEPQYGDIVVFHNTLPDGSTEKNLVKRIIGLPGDHISISGGVVIRNGTMLPEAYLKSGVTLGSMSELTVPEDSYFVMGDNREVSNDSRNFGCVSKEQLYGKVVLRIFPLDGFRTF